jgi:hypothetical protein
LEAIMQELFFLKQATDHDKSKGRRAGKFLGLLVAGLLASHTLSVISSAQSATPNVKPNLSAEKQKVPPALQTQEEWRKAMSRKAPPKKGCFTAAYPKMDWVEVQCAPVTSGFHWPALGNTSGNNNTFFATAIGVGSLTGAMGSFDSVSGATSVKDSITNQTDTFSLQLNTNFFPVSLCTDGSTCGWQQFVFGSFGCEDLNNNNQLTDCVFIEYWLRDWTPCPMGWTQVTDGTRNHCVVLRGGALVMPHQSITSLKNLSLAARLQVTSDSDPAQNSVVAIFGTGGTMFSVSDEDFLDLGLNLWWQDAEFNVFGQDKASQARFNSPTTLVVRTQIDYTGGNMAPDCFFDVGFTRESNNLNLMQRLMITAAPLPSIAFQESTNSPTQGPQCAASVGDTHLTTFDGLFYDFQASGEFLLAQPAPDFIVQTQQVSGAPKWPNAAINKAVGIKMGKTQVAICLAPYRLEIDSNPVYLDNGKSLSLPGGVSFLRSGDTYLIWRPGGDLVRADVNINEYIDVYVGQAPGAKVRGLLGNANGATRDDIAMQGGGVLKQPVSFTDLYGRYADSWRVPPNQSLLCSGQKIEHGKPNAPIYAQNLTQSQYNYARGVCTAAGVKNPTLLDACILDVTVIGSDKAAQPFVRLTPPVAVMRTKITVSLPTNGVQTPPGGTPLPHN